MNFEELLIARLLKTSSAFFKKAAKIVEKSGDVEQAMELKKLAEEGKRQLKAWKKIA